MCPTLTLSEYLSLIQRADDFVKVQFCTENSGHDYWHLARVRGLADLIAREEDVDPMPVVPLAALLHDLDDWKLVGGGESAIPARAEAWLLKEGADNHTASRVLSVISEVSFRGAEVPMQFTTPEARVVHDADKLDAIGAIGIARVFAFSGACGRVILDPAVEPTSHKTADEYMSSRSSAIIHFYEKLLLLCGRMQTETGKRLAASRHQFLLDFLMQFWREWHDSVGDVPTFLNR